MIVSRTSSQLLFRFDLNRTHLEYWRKEDDYVCRVLRVAHKSDTYTQPHNEPYHFSLIVRLVESSQWELYTLELRVEVRRF